MKKEFIAITVLLVMFSSSIFAQSGKFSLGVEGGAGISNTRGLFEPGLGYTGQIFCDYHLSKIFSTHIGFGYEQKGAYDEIIVTDNNGASLYNSEIKQGFDFLTLPVLVRANFGSRINYFVNAGPFFNYLLKQSSQVDDSNSDLTSEINNTSSYERFEVGFSLGAGLAISLIEKINLSFEIRNNLGLTNLSKIEGATAKTNSAQLLVGLAYSL